MSAQGWDVLLSGLSLGIWAAIRGLDATNMLKATVPASELLTGHTQEAMEDTSAALKDKVEDIATR